MLILGIDPGTRITGYGLVRKEGARIVHVDNGCIIPKTSDAMPLRLAFILEHLEQLLTDFKPDGVAVEKAFFAKNATSALKLGQCRGIVLATAARAQIPVFEYSPKGIKQAVTGSGNAEKEQLQKMVRLILSLPEVPQVDASDALAVALCHAQSYEMVSAQSKLKAQ